MNTPLQLIIILLCMGGQAFFAGVETGVVSIHRLRLRHFVREGSAGAAILQGFLENSDRLLGTTLVGTNVCTVVVSVTAASLAGHLIGPVGDVVSAVLVALLMLVFCEYLPKSWFHARPIERCERFAGLLRLSEIVLKPISAVIVWLSRRLIPGPSASFSKPLPFVTREDLKILAREGEKDGVLSPRERVMIHRVFELSGKQAAEIMMPLEQIKSVAATATMAEFFEAARSSGLTRLPVYDRAAQKYAGVANVFHLLLSGVTDLTRPVSDFIRPPLIIPGDMPVDDIFPRLRRSRQPLCLVADKQSGTVVGLITTEDILEEIVGKL